MKFILWLEEREDQRKLQNMLLSRLGLSTNISLQDNPIKISTLNKKNLISAIESMNLDSDKVELLKNWLNQSPDGTLQDLLNQITSDAPPSVDAQETLPYVDAKLPG